MITKAVVRPRLRRSIFWSLTIAGVTIGASMFGFGFYELRQEERLYVEGVRRLRETVNAAAQDISSTRGGCVQIPGIHTLLGSGTPTTAYGIKLGIVDGATRALETSDGDVIINSTTDVVIRP